MILVLDCQAFSLLVDRDRPEALRRLQGLIQQVQARNGLVRVPAAVLAETYRGPRREAEVNRLTKRRTPVVTTGQSMAKEAGRLLHRDGKDSCHAIDALVVATAIRLAGDVVIATSDPDDIDNLARDHHNVKVFTL